MVLVVVVLVVAGGWYQWWRHHLWSTPRGRTVDVSRFYLVEPVRCPGVHAGPSACTVDTNQDLSPFLRHNADGSVELWLPATGATARSSVRLRTELKARVGTVLGSNTGSLSADVALRDASSSETVDAIVGELHMAGADAFMMLHLGHRRGGKAGFELAVTLKTGPTAVLRRSLLTGVVLGEPVHYTLSNDPDQVTVSVRCRDKQTVFSSPIPAVFRGREAVYLVGDYRQNAGEPDSRGSRLTIYSLDLRVPRRGTGTAAGLAQARS